MFKDRVAKTDAYNPNYTGHKVSHFGLLLSKPAIRAKHAIFLAY